MTKLLSLFAAGAALGALQGCDQPPAVYVDGGYVRLNPNPQAPSAAYFTIHAGNAPITLRGIATDEAVRAEMHESMTQGGMAAMSKLDAVDIPAKGVLKFQPGGKHVMLWQLNPQALADGRISFTFIFSNGDRILADAVVQKADGTAAGNAASSEHQGH